MLLFAEVGHKWLLLQCQWLLSIWCRNPTYGVGIFSRFFLWRNDYRYQKDCATSWLLSIPHILKSMGFFLLSNSCNIVIAHFWICWLFFSKASLQIMEKKKLFSVLHFFCLVSILHNQKHPKITFVSSFIVVTFVMIAVTSALLYQHSCGGWYSCHNLLGTGCDICYQFSSGWTKALVHVSGNSYAFIVWPPYL